MSRLLATALILGGLAGGCILQTSGLAPTDGDGDADGDTDGDVDADADADPDAGPDAADADEPSDADAGRDARADGDAPSDTDPDIGPWLEPYAARKSISITAPTLTGPLRPFVVGVIVRADGDLARVAREEGFIDLAFTTADATTRLEHEIESFDNSSGTLVAWVRLPELPASGRAELFMYYLGASESVRRDTAPTWSGLCAGVWHLADACEADRIRDSSENTNHGVTETPRRPGCVPGLAGRARSFDGTDDVITIGDPGDGSLDFDMNAFSYSAWVKVVSSVERWDMPWYKGGASVGNPGYDFELGEATWTVSSSDGSRVVSGSFGVEGDLLGRWVHLVAAFDRGANRLRMYADGVRVENIDISGYGSMSNDTEATLGHATHRFRGDLDEVRVYSFAVNDDWVRAVHANLVAPGTFLTVGTEVTAP